MKLEDLADLEALLDKHREDVLCWFLKASGAPSGGMIGGGMQIPEPVGLKSTPMTTRFGSAPFIQTDMASLILAIAKANGVSAAMGIAMVCNAYKESSLDPTAIGDSGNSVGLFQLHQNGGGRGLTVEQRKNPETNTLRIISELRDAERNTAAKAALARCYSPSDLTAWFSTYVERPADKPAEEIARRAICKRLYPTVSDVAASQLRW